MVDRGIKLSVETSGFTLMILLFIYIYLVDVTFSSEYLSLQITENKQNF